jgi:hypothetical protein
MATYRPFYVGFWDDPDIEKFSPEEKLVYAFLFTNHLCTESGIYSLSQKNICERTGIKLCKINDIIKKLQNTYHKITYDNTIIFVHGFMHRNYKGSPEKLELSILKDFENHRSLACWSKFIEIYSRHCISNKIKDKLNTLQSVTDTSMEVSNSNSNRDSISNSNESKEDSNSNKPKEIKKIIIPEEINEAFKAFEEMRKNKKKPLTEYAKKLILKDLEELYPNNYEMQIKSLNKSTKHSWQGVFKYEENSNNFNQQQVRQYAEL